MPENRPQAPPDGIYRAILMALVGTVMAGALVSIAGETVYGDPALSRLGAIVALVAAALYVFFRFLGQREARRRARNAPHADDDADADP